MKYILTLLLIPIILAAGGLKTSETDRQIVYHLFNGDVVIADSLLKAQLNSHPESPKYNLLMAQYHFYARYFSNIDLSRDSVLNLMEHYAEKAIQLGDQQEETTENKFYIGSAYGYLSRVYGMRQEYWNAYWAAKDCYSYLEEVLEEDPEFYDAYMGLGVIEYYTGARLTGIMNTIAWLVGMSGDRQTGLDYFDLVYQYGNLFKPEGHIALALMYRFTENNIEKATPLMDEYITLYPNNNMVLQRRQEVTLYEIVDNEGVQALAAQKDSLIEKYQIVNSFVFNAMGYTLVGQERLDDALAIFKLNIELFPGIANCYDSLAECYMTRGEYAKSIEYYKLALEILESDNTVNDDGRITFRERVNEQLAELNNLLRT